MDNGNMQENGGAGSSSGEGTGFTTPNANNNAFVSPGEKEGFAAGNAEHSAFIQPGEDTGNTQSGEQGSFAGAGSQGFNQEGTAQGGFSGPVGDGFSQGSTQGGFTGPAGNGFTQGSSQSDGFTQPGGNGFTQGSSQADGFTRPNGQGFTQPNGGYSQPPVQGGYSQSTGSVADSNAFPIAGMVLGILSIICCCCNSYISVLLAAGALAFSIISIVKNSPGRGMAIAGVVCGAVGLLISIGLIIVSWVMPSNAYTQQIYDILEQYQEQGDL